MIKSDNSFQYSFENGELTIMLSGEIDHHGAAILRGAIDKQICEKRPKVVSIDMSKIGFMDSSGLGLIMGRYSLQHSLGGELKIINPSESTEKIFKLSGIGRIIKIENVKRKDDKNETK